MNNSFPSLYYMGNPYFHPNFNMQQENLYTNQSHMSPYIHQRSQFEIDGSYHQIQSRPQIATQSNQMINNCSIRKQTF